MTNQKTVVILCDIIVDLGMRFKSFPIKAGDIQRLSSLQLTSGGASNVAIMASRFGLNVIGLSEIGDDVFGKLLIDELTSEGIDISSMQILKGGTTPVAGVLIDDSAEPAYLGISGSGKLQTLPKKWTEAIGKTDAVYASGWADHVGIVKIVLEGFRLAKQLGKDTFFDLGPGNPAVDNSWIKAAIKETKVLSCNEGEALLWSGASSIEQAAGFYFYNGVKTILLKMGAKGCAIITEEEWIELPAYPSEVVDKTGAGDSVSGSLLYTMLNNWELNEVGVLANLTGGAKVQKIGTGKNLPTMKEIKKMMKEYKIGFSSQI